MPQVAVARSQPSPAATSAGAAVSRWPGEVVSTGTAWQVAHAIGALSRRGAVTWAVCAPTPIAVENMLPSRPRGGAGVAPP